MSFVLALFLVALPVPHPAHSWPPWSPQVARRSEALPAFSSPPAYSWLLAPPLMMRRFGALPPFSSPPAHTRPLVVPSFSSPSAYSWPLVVPSFSSPSAYFWPLSPPRVVRRFESPPQPWLAGHRGVDLGGAPGAMVRVTTAGTVVYAGSLAGRGVVSVVHTGGLRSTYEPVTPSVTTGRAVTAGQPLGILEPGHPGCPVAACLHWGVRSGAGYLDPLTLLGLGRVRLLPMPGLEQGG